MKISSLPNEKKLIDLNKGIVEYKKTLMLLITFIKDPMAATIQIVDDIEHELNESFKNIKLGLTGNETKARTVELGKQKLEEYLNGIITTLTNNYAVPDDAKEVYTSIANEYEDLLNVLNIQVIMLRKDAYLANSSTRQYMDIKLSSIIADKLSVTQDSKEAITTYLQQLLGLLGTLNDFKAGEQLKADILAYKQFQDITAIEIEHIKERGYGTPIKESMLEYNKEPLDINEYIMLTMETIAEIDSGIAPLDALLSLIDKLPTVLNKFKDNIDYFKSILAIYLEHNKGIKPKVISQLTILNATIVKDYLETRITEEEFITGSDAYLKMVTNCSVWDHFIFGSINNTGIELATNMSVYNNIYGLVDTITLAGTLDKNIILSK